MTAPLPLEEAQARLLALVTPLAAETAPVEAALGRYTAVPLRALRTQPAADLSAMDGYALRGPGPWRVIGESRAGHPFAGSIGGGEAVRVSTGALMPHGAETMLLQEDARRDGHTLQLAGDPPEPGRHIRRAGFDFHQGDELLPTGTHLGPAAIALALSAGHRVLEVHRAPQVAIIDSGDELAADPADCGPHQIPASNGAMLAAMAGAIPCTIKRIGPVPDDLSTLAQALDAARDADLVVTSGGASVGDHDLIRPALETAEARIAFWRVAIRPGKPLLVATRGRQIVLGLPGNPVSSFVTAYLFMLPLLRALAGAREPLPRPVALPVASDLPPGGERREFLRARWDGSALHPAGQRDSSALLALAGANALIDRPANAVGTKAGTPVPVYLLGNGGIA
jgi:molybdopterin molybdotransferase